MAEHDERGWRLERDGRALATLALVGTDMPWSLCTVEPVSNSGFEEVRSVTDAAQRALSANDDAEVLRLFSELRTFELSLVPLDGGPSIEKFILWFDGDSARLRFVDESAADHDRG